MILFKPAHFLVPDININKQGKYWGKKGKQLGKNWVNNW